MNSKLFILVIAVNLSAIYALPGNLVGNGLIGARGVIGAAPIGALDYGGYGGAVGYAGHAVAAPVGLGLNGGYGLGAYGTGLSDFRLLSIGHGLTPYQGPVAAAIETIRTHHVIDVPTSPDAILPSTLIVEPNVMPVNIEFRSQSSPVNVNQVHIPGRPGIVERTASEEEPDRLIHEVVKPVVQEVRETIVPFRRITQEILPVQEEVHSLVARGQNQKVLAAAAPVAAVGLAGHAVAGPVAVGGLGGLITTGINRIGAYGGGLVGGGLVNGGLINGGVITKEILRARS